MLDNIKISAIGDELGNTLIEQIETIKSVDINKIELRKIDDKYLHEFSKQDLHSFAHTLEEHNINVSLIDTPIGKNKSNLSSAQLFNQYVTILKIFSVNKLRVFSDLNDSYASSIELFKSFNKIAKTEKITILIENEKKTMASNPEYFYKFPNLTNVEFLMDIENYVYEGYDYFQVYEILKNKVSYFHIRDWDKHKKKFVYIGKKNKKIYNFFTNIVANSVISFETHFPLNYKFALNSNEKKDLFIKNYEYFIRNYKRMMKNGKKVL